MPTPAITPAHRRRALRAFRQRGYSVHAKALDTVLTAFHTSLHDQLSDFLDLVFDHLAQAGSTHDGIVSESAAADAAALVARRDSRAPAGDDVAAASVRILETVDSFSVPRWRGTSTDSRSVAGTPSAKAALYRARYELVRSKTLRNARFTPPASGLLAGSARAYLQLTGVESLAGASGDRLVLGMLAQLEEGQWYLEDAHGNVRLDVSSARVTAGMHSEGSFVVAHGCIDESPTLNGGAPVFRVSAMGTPPLERREDSVAAIGTAANLFGGAFSAADIPALMEREKEEEEAMILILSDVHLDSVRVVAALRHVFEGYVADNLVPTVVVLMGAFLSRPFGQRAADVQLLAAHFTELGRMIADDFPQVAAHTSFVLIPAATDPGPGNVLPRPPLPSIVTRGFVEALGKERVHLASNPCRLRYMSQELVLFREDLMHLMVRHCAVKPDMAESQLLSEHLVKSVVDQAHLCSLPITARPIIWNHDQALWLFPVPHVVCLADKVDSYVCKYGGTLGLNPGSFASHFSFIAYLPADRSAQQCSIDAERARADSAPSTPSVRSDDDDDYGNDSDDSGRSVLSLLRARGGKQHSDDEEEEEKEEEDGKTEESLPDIDMDLALVGVENNGVETRMQETGPVMTDSEHETGTQEAAKVASSADAVAEPGNGNKGAETRIQETGPVMTDSEHETGTQEIAKVASSADAVAEPADGNKGAETHIQETGPVMMESDAELGTQERTEVTSNAAPKVQETGPVMADSGREAETQESTEVTSNAVALAKVRDQVGDANNGADETRVQEASPVMMMDSEPATGTQEIAKVASETVAEACDAQSQKAVSKQKD